VWFAMQVFFSYGEGTAWFAHIGGFIFGLVMVKPFRIGRPRR
jgi:membrane associated rhomboid family serine protease